MKKQVDSLKSLNLANKIDELKQIESVFPKNRYCCSKVHRHYHLPSGIHGARWFNSH